MMLRASIAAVAGFSILFALGQPAHAVSIGVNFATSGTGANFDLAAADITGAVPQANWNNAHNTSPSLSNLANDQGNGTGASMTWDHNPISTPSGMGLPAYLLLSSGIALSHDPTHLDVTVSQIPFTKYDVYLYFTHFGSSPDVVDYNLNFNVAPYAASAMVIQDEGNRNTFTAAWAYPSPPDYLNVGANYARLTGLVGPTLTISGSSDQFGDLALDGFQIVEVPEPSGLALLCIGGLGAVVAIGARRWRRLRRPQHLASFSTERVPKPSSGTTALLAATIALGFGYRRMRPKMASVETRDSESCLLGEVCNFRLAKLVAMTLLAICSIAKLEAATVTFSDFSNTSGLVVNGNAAQALTADGYVLRVAPTGAFQSGSFFSQTQLNAASFSTRFEFRLTNPGGISDGTEAGADGFVFVVQPLSASIGGAGGGLGYQGISPSVGIEFDTFRNGWDPDSNHLGVDVNGSVSSVATAGVATRFDDGNAWFAWIDYDGSTLEVRANQTGVRPSLSLLSLNLDLPGIIGSNSAYVGFTAGTGNADENHDILNWTYHDSFTVPEPSTIVLAGLAATGLAVSALRRRRQCRS